VLLNLAQSQLRAGRYAEAAENFAKYIRENPSAEAMSHAKAAFEEARDRVGEVSVEVNATGAVINVDGSDVGKSPLPYAVYMMPGRHTVRASKGGLSADESLEAIAGQRMGTIGIDDRRRGAALLRDADEVVAVETLALERDEEIALGQRARVGRHAVEAHVLAEHPTVDRARRRRGIHHSRSSCRASAVAATSASENGVRTPSRSW